MARREYQNVPKPRRILLVKPSALGDVVHALPVLSLLRKQFPAARVSWLVAPAFASLLDGHPLVDEVILFDRRGMDARRVGPVGSVAGFAELARELSSRQFDLAIDLQGLLRSALLTWASGAPVRVGFGYAREGASLAYTHRVGHGAGGAERHAVERYLDVAEALGCGRGPVDFSFHVTDADRSAVELLIGHAGPFAVLLPGTNWPTKKWPTEYFGRLGPMIERELGLRIVVAGASDVLGVASGIPGAIDLATKTTLPQLVELLRRASLVIANDSGPMHIASALNRPMVTVFGPTNPVRTGPYQRDDTVLRLNVPCSPCYSRTCCHRICLDWLAPEQVLAAARLQVRMR